MPHASPSRSGRKAVACFLALTLGGLLALTGTLTTADEQAPSEAAKLRAQKSSPLELAKAIDHVIDTKLEAKGITPAPRAGDAEFLRRIYLDLIGTVPTVPELEAFLADRSGDKRTKKIDELLESDAYAAHWGVVWFKATTGLSPAARGTRSGQGARYVSGKSGQTYLEWLQDQMAENRPYDEWVHDLLTATGRTDEDGQTGFIARWSENSNNLASATAKTFLGTRIQCAQCHDHIYEDKWKQKDFRGMAAFFSNLRTQRAPEYRQAQQLRRQIEAIRQKERDAKRVPELGKAKPGEGMDGMDSMDGMEADPAAKRRERNRKDKRGGDGMYKGEKLPSAAEIAKMSPREQNELLRKFRGSGNVLVIDDTTPNPRAIEIAKRRLEARLRAGNNPNLERLKERMELAATAPKFWMASEVTDIPGISRRLLLSRWVTSGENELFSRTVANRYWGHFFGTGIVDPIDDFNSFNDPSHPEILDVLSKDLTFGKFDLKRLIRIIVNTEAYQRTSTWTAEEEPESQLFAKAAVRPFTTEQLYHSLVRASGMERRLDRVSRRAGQRIQQAIFSVFSFVFDDDEGKEAQDFSGSIPQGLFLMNGQLMQNVVSARPGSLLYTLMRTQKKDADRVEYLYKAVYGRSATTQEKSGAVRFLKDAAASQGGVQRAYEDLLWAMLNSAEFMTNH